MNNYTLVSGLWNIGRDERNFESHYLSKFKEFLHIESNMILFLPKELEEFEWKHLLNPEFWSSKVSEQLPIVFSMFVISSFVKVFLFTASSSIAINILTHLT